MFPVIGGMSVGDSSKSGGYLFRNPKMEKLLTDIRAEIVNIRSNTDVLREVQGTILSESFLRVFAVDPVSPRSPL